MKLRFTKEQIYKSPGVRMCIECSGVRDNAYHLPDIVEVDLEVDAEPVEKEKPPFPDCDCQESQMYPKITHTKKMCFLNDSQLPELPEELDNEWPGSSKVWENRLATNSVIRYLRAREEYENFEKQKEKFGFCCYCFASTCFPLNHKRNFTKDSTETCVCSCKCHPVQEIVV